MRGLLHQYAPVFSSLQRGLDIALLFVGAYLAHWLRFDHLALSSDYTELVIIAALCGFILFSRFSLYDSWRGVSLLSELRALSFALIALCLAIFAVLVLTKTSYNYSRQWLSLWFAISWVLLAALRVGVRVTLRWMRAGGANSRTLLLVGPQRLCTRVARRIDANPGLGLRVAGRFGPDVSPSDESGPRHLGDYSDIAPYLDQRHADQVWLTLPLRAEDTLRRVLHDLRHSTVDIRMVPDLFGMRLLNQSIGEMAGLPIIDLSRSPMVGLNRIVKALEDRILALIILILVSPLMVAIAAAIKRTSPGPVLFSQLRHGVDGRIIRVYKFRTMQVHDEPPGQVLQATRHDPRVTRIGAFLRHTNLDELPQFFNVLRGDMAIVGPRPHALEHNRQYKDQIDRYMLRHRVKPGITGWAQVNGLRGETNTLEKMRKRIEYDLYYIENWSIWFDLRIIVLTLTRGFGSPNAY